MLKLTDLHATIFLETNSKLLFFRNAIARRHGPVLSNEEAAASFWILDKDGLITKVMEGFRRREWGGGGHFEYHM